MEIKADNELLTEMIADMKAQNALHRPTPYWDWYIDYILNGLKTYGIKDFRGHWEISKGFGDPILLEPWERPKNQFKVWAFKTVVGLPIFSSVAGQYRSMRDWYASQIRDYKARYYRAVIADLETGVLKNRDLPEMLVGSPGDTFDLNGQTYATLYLDFAARINTAAKRIPLDRVRSVFEVGGGFGGNAHLLVHLYPNIRKYLIVDIPPILYCETQYLKAFFGNAVRDYRAVKAQDEVSFRDDDSLEFIVIAPWQLNQMNDCQIDVFWNSASFQEMEKDVVAFYAEEAAQKKPNWVYLYTLKNGLTGSASPQNEPVEADFIKGCFSDRMEFCELDPPLDPEHGKYVHLIGALSEHPFE
jgi:putative sugar O-methyltransferase